MANKEGKEIIQKILSKMESSNPEIDLALFQIRKLPLQSLKGPGNGPKSRKEGRCSFCCREVPKLRDFTHLCTYNLSELIDFERYQTT